MGDVIVDSYIENSAIRLSASGIDKDDGSGTVGMEASHGAVVDISGRNDTVFNDSVTDMTRRNYGCWGENRKQRDNLVAINEDEVAGEQK